MDQLTEQDFDALYAALRKEMPRIPRSIFPDVLAQLMRDGLMTMSVAEQEILIGMPDFTDASMHRVRRGSSLYRAGPNERLVIDRS
ncbi:MAG TPA: hypothetical protein VKF40_09580 [Burkholderiales bacterium]|nr:hypothetical protein [Burkholderiales bacterium]